MTSRGHGSLIAAPLAALAGLIALSGCRTEIPRFEVLPQFENRPAAVRVGASLTVDGRLPKIVRRTELECEMAATDLGLRMRLSLPGTGTVFDAVITPDRFDAHLPSAKKAAGCAFDDLKPRIRSLIGFVRGGYVGIVSPRLLPLPGESVRCFESGRTRSIEYYAQPHGRGTMSRRVVLGHDGLPLRLERFAPSGRRVFIIQYLAYSEPSDDDSGSAALPSKLRMTVPYVARANLDLHTVKPAPALHPKTFSLKIPKSAKRVDLGAPSKD